MAANPRSGTGYIGLEQWLGQNRQQAANMAGKIATGLDSRGNRAAGLLSDAKEEFKMAADQGVYQYNGDGLDGTPGAEFSGLPEALRLAKIAEASKYTGPEEMKNIGNYVKGRPEAESTEAATRAANDQYGRQAMLQKDYGSKGGYSLGQQRLDSALVGAAGGDRLAAARAQWGGLVGKYNAADVDAKNYATLSKSRHAEMVKQQVDKANGLRAGYADWEKKQAQQQTSQQEADRLAEVDGRILDRDSDIAAGESRGIPGGPKGGNTLDRWTGATKRDKQRYAPPRPKRDTQPLI